MATELTRGRGQTRPWRSDGVVFWPVNLAVDKSWRWGAFGNSNRGTFYDSVTRYRCIARLPACINRPSAPRGCSGNANSDRTDLAMLNRYGPMRRLHSPCGWTADQFLPPARGGAKVTTLKAWARGRHTASELVGWGWEATQLLASARAVLTANGSV